MAETLAQIRYEFELCLEVRLDTLENEWHCEDLTFQPEFLCVTCGGPAEAILGNVECADCFDEH